MGTSPLPVQRHGNYGEGCRKNYDAHAKEKKTQGRIEKGNPKSLDLGQSRVARVFIVKKDLTFGCILWYN